MKPVYAKTPDTRLAGLERRVRFLERRSQTPEPDLYGATGIQFEVDNEGGWLSVSTTGVDPTSLAGIFFHSTAGIELQNVTDGILHVRNTTDLGIHIDDGYTGEGGDGIRVTSSTSGVSISGGVAGVSIDGGIAVGVHLEGKVYAAGLPGADPSSTGALYVDGSGFVKRSA